MEAVLSLCKFLAISLAFSGFVAQDSLAYLEAPQRAKTVVKTQGKGISEVSCLSHIVWRETNGQTLAAQYAVGNVVLNRANRTGKSVCDIIWMKGQFSGFDGNVPKLRTINPISLLAHNMMEQERLGIRIDITNGATHFATHKVKNKWTKKFKRVYSDSAHHFYKEH
jgi:spore germination cell wall hydrolase CwlJ-like protein